MKTAFIGLTMMALAVLSSEAHTDDGDYLSEINLTRSAQPDNSLSNAGWSARHFEFIPIHPVNFAHDEHTLDDRAHSVLDDAALLIRNLPGVTRVIVKGYTDIVAGEEYNNALSDRRAAVVRDYLIERGVAEWLLHTNGFGKSTPVDEEWTRYGRSRNRRVEIFVVREQGNGLP